VKCFLDGLLVVPIFFVALVAAWLLDLDDWELLEA